MTFFYFACSAVLGAPCVLLNQDRSQSKRKVREVFLEHDFTARLAMIYDPVGISLAGFA